MHSHISIFNEAMQSYKEAHLAEAALLFRRAAAAALSTDDRASWFRYTVWAATSTRDSGKTSVAMALLFSARESEPDDRSEYEAWIARKLPFTIVLDSKP